MNAETAKTVFWTGIGAVLYTYVGYPILVDLASRLHRRTGAAARGDAGEAPLPGRQCGPSIRRQLDWLNTAQAEGVKILLP